MASSAIAAAAALVRQYFEGGYYPSGQAGVSAAWKPSAALVKAVLLTGAQGLDWISSQDGSVESAKTYFRPNEKFGFGLLELTSALRVKEVVTNPSTECKCNGHTITSNRFGANYGTYCAPWNSMPDGRPQTCSTMFPAAGAAGRLGPWCCQSWCFVDAGCSVGVPFPIGSVSLKNVSDPIFAEFEGIFVSYDVCQDSLPVVEECVWRTGDGVVDVRTMARDHVLDLNAQNETYDPISAAQQITPSAGAIAENETFTYTTAVSPPLGLSNDTAATRMVITLTWTDPPGSPGQVSLVTNNLDLTVRITPLVNGSTISYSLPLLQVLQYQRREADMVMVYGDRGDHAHGDPHNNVEQIWLEIKEASILDISVAARRVAVGSGPLAATQAVPCQAFALVWSGPLLGSLVEPPVFSASPFPLPAGICGRRVVTSTSHGDTTLLIVAIVISFFGAGTSIALVWYRCRAVTEQKVQAQKDSDSPGGGLLGRYVTPEPMVPKSVDGTAFQVSL
mmetsp:Transcript_59235/g.157323  ORF Transcript_59235/g.157323 Transcript_59235/m.157323 type:complete len:506 (+) Transcript_59235:5129-6646(+)